MKFKIKYSILSLQKRLLVLFILIAFIFCVLLVRVFYLQGVRQDSLVALAVPQWVRTLPISAKRGDILDCTGSVLATSYTTYDIYVRAKNIENPDVVADTLSAILGENRQKIYEKARNKSISESLIKLSVEEDVANKIIEKNLKGVVLSQNISRYYPYGQFLTQVLGFTTIDNIGQAGVEAYYNEYLKGVNGKALSQGDASGVEIEGVDYYIPSVDGLNIMLTIDSKIQAIIEKALYDIQQEHNPKSASIIMLNAKTGEILGMGMSPSYDNNNPPRNDVSTLMELTKNKAVVDVYEPGSTFKILTVAAALSEGVTSFSDRFYCPGYRVVDEQKIKCWRSIGHGSQTLAEGICNSCNCVFMDLGLRLGKEKLYKYLKLFGIGSSTGVDILGESSGLLMDQSLVKTVDLARISFGQAVAVSQLQLITAFCSIINGGTLVTPHILKSIYNGTSAVKTNETIKKSVTVSSKVSKQVNELLKGVLSLKNGEGTFVTGYDIGGKTGTAQKYENGVIARGKYVSSFFGTYPALNPEYALLICVNEPSNGVYYGSVVASPYGKQIFEDLFEYKNIPRDFDNEKSTTIVPNVVGKSLSEAIIEIDKSKLNYEIDGEGSVIVSQYPSGGTEVSSGETMVIVTN